MYSTNGRTRPDRKSGYVYRLEGKAGWAHLNMRDKQGRNTSGFYTTGAYRYLAEVDGEALRETAAWQAWCRARPEAADLAQQQG